MVGDAHGGRLVRRFDAQLAAEHLVGRCQRELQRGGAAVGSHGLDLLHAQLAGIEQQLLGGLVLPLQAVGGRAADLLGVEIDLQVQRQVLDDDLVRFGVGAFIVAAADGIHGGGGLLGDGVDGGGCGLFGAASDERHGQGQHQERRTH